MTPRHQVPLANWPWFWLLLVCVVLAGGAWLCWRLDNPEPFRPEPSSNAVLEKQPRLRAVRELGVPSFTQKRTVHHSTGCEKRARELCDLLEAAVGFYEDRLHLRAEFSVAVLTRPDWERVEKGVPFGLPSVSPPPHVVLLPATADGVVTRDVLALRGTVSPATRRKIEQAGFTFDEAAEKLTDLVGLHELGHVLTLADGIGPPSRWANEFLASYFALAYLRESHPPLADLFVAMTHDLQYRDGDRPRYTSLEDFDLLYSRVGSANYGWYQSAFVGRVEQVYEVKKFAFLEGVQAAYPTGTPEGEPARVILERLERICPGFVAWGAGLR